jgi:hypothetical protein
MFNLSSAEGARFAEVCEEMTEAVAALGPNPLKSGRGGDGITGSTGSGDGDVAAEGGGERPAALS